MSVIAVPTATRAEYGNLRPFIQELRDNGFEVRIIATGAHLSQAYGETYKEIEEDGFVIDYQIPILVDADNACGVSKTMALAISGFADYFANRRPDALLVLGDRYEMLALWGRDDRRCNRRGNPSLYNQDELSSFHLNRTL